MDAGLTLAERSGRGRVYDMTVRVVDFPHPFSGDERFRNGEIAKASIACACMHQSAIATISAFSATT
jgi:hypothetical protein